MKEVADEEKMCIYIYIIKNKKIGAHKHTSVMSYIARRGVEGRG